MCTSNWESSLDSCFSGAVMLDCKPCCMSFSSSWPMLAILAAEASASWAPAASRDLAALCALRPAKRGQE